jgi:prevent-host-death family protein
MNRIIGVTELQRKFSAIFNEVARRHTPYILTRGSRPEVVMIPYEQYLKYVQSDEKGIVERMDRTLARMAELNAHYSDDQVEADLIEATKIVRSRKRR